jgi:RecA/RadA recombinase
MATAVQEARALTPVDDDADGEQRRQLAEMVSKHRAREAETQLKLVIIDSLAGLLPQPQQPGTAGDGWQRQRQQAAASGTSSMQVQALMTTYSATWSTLAYCDKKPRGGRW